MVAAMVLGVRLEPGVPQPGTTRLPAVPRSATLDQFVEVSGKAGIHFKLTSGGPEKRYIIEAKGGGGAAWIDYNHDGFPDLFLVNGSTFEHWKRGDSPPSRLYRNNGDGKFTDVTLGSGLDQTGWGMGVCVGDYDNDGHDDLYVTYYGGNVLYHNNGNGTFADVTGKAGVRGHGWGMGCAFDDYDNGGRPDVYVANDSTPSSLYHNNGNGTFTDVGVPAGVAYSGEGQEQAGMGTDFADYDNDGWPDLVKGNFSDDTKNLYHNNGDGTFTDATYVAGLGDAGWLFTTFGAKFLDYDNDGWKDVILANGQVFPQIDRYQTGITYAERKLLFHKRGPGQGGVKFDEVGLRSGPGFAAKKVSRGLAVADYDNDGDVEILVTNMNDSPDLLRHAHKNPRHSILVQTVGTRSNRDGIGAKVTVATGGLTEYDEVRSGGSYLSSSDLRLHFGVGAATKIDRLEVSWPSGQKDAATNLSVDRHFVVKEGQGVVETRPLRKAPEVRK